MGMSGYVETPGRVVRWHMRVVGGDPPKVSVALTVERGAQIDGSEPEIRRAVVEAMTDRLARRPGKRREG